MIFSSLDTLPKEVCTKFSYSFIYSKPYYTYMFGKLFIFVTWKSKILFYYDYVYVRLCKYASWCFLSYDFHTFIKEEDKHKNKNRTSFHNKLCSFKHFCSLKSCNFVVKTQHHLFLIKWFKVNHIKKPKKQFYCRVNIQLVVLFIYFVLILLRRICVTNTLCKRVCHVGKFRIQHLSLYVSI